MLNARKIIRIGVLCFTLLAILFSTLLFGRVASAAVVVSIAEMEVTCTSISLVYTVSGSAPGATASIIAWNGDGTDVGFGGGPGTPGTWTATVSVGNEPAGTILYVTVTVDPVTTTSARVPCSGGGSGGGSGSGPPSWSGYGDGRLNPVPDEYYSVWCKANQIEVWRAVPQTILISKIPIAAVLALGTRGSFNAGSGLTVARNNDSVTISGSNGNNAPHAGSKSFSLQDCIGHNGGAPPAVVAPRQPQPIADVTFATAAAPVLQLPTATATLDPCDPFISGPTPIGTPIGPWTAACFATHPCVLDPASLDCGHSYPCQVNSNTWDCKLWQSWDCCFGWGIVIAPPFAFPFVLRTWLRRKKRRSKPLPEGMPPADDISPPQPL